MTGWKIYLVVILFIISGNAPAQSNEQWIQAYFNFLPTNRNWSLQLDGGFRWSNGFSNGNQHIIRGALSWRIQENLSVSGGLAQSGWYTSGISSRVEIRPYLELKFIQPKGKWSFQHRYRLEERFLNSDLPESSWEKSLVTRLRYSIMASRPLQQKTDGSGWIIYLGNEFFLSLGGMGSNHIGAEQNRFLVGPAYKFGNHAELALMYNGQYSAIGGKFSHIAWLQYKQKIQW